MRGVREGSSPVTASTVAPWAATRRPEQRRAGACAGTEWGANKCGVMVLWREVLWLACTRWHAVRQGEAMVCTVGQMCSSLCKSL